MKIGLLCSIVRKEEKLLIEELRSRGLDFQVLDDREIIRLSSVGSSVHWLHFFSPDSRFLSVNYGNHTNCMWDITREKVVLRVPESDWWTFSPDSRFMAASHPDGSLSLHSTDGAGEARRVLISTYLRRLQFHPDGTRVGGIPAEGDRVVIADVRTGQILVTLISPNRLVSLAFSNDGGWVAAGTEDGHIYVWDVATGELHLNIDAHQNAVRGVEFNHASTLLGSVSWDGNLRLWDALNGHLLISSPSTGYHLQFATDDHSLAYHDGLNISVLEIASHPEFRLLARGKRELGAWALAFSPDGRLLAASDQDIRFWDTATAKELAVLPDEPPRSLHFHPDGKSLLSSGPGLYRRAIESNDTVSNTLRLGPRTPLLPEGGFMYSDLTPDGRFFAAAQLSKAAAVVFDFENPSALVTLGPHPNMSVVAISPDGRFVASGTWQGSGVKVWDVATRQLLRDLPASTHAKVLFSPNGRWLATSADDYRLYEVGSWQLRFKVPVPHDGVQLNDIAFSPDDKIWAIGNKPHNTHLYATVTGQRLAILEPPQQATIVGLAFSPDGTTLAVLQRDRAIQLWDLRRIRHELAALELDWDQPAYPDVVRPETKPIRLEVAENPAIAERRAFLAREIPVRPPQADAHLIDLSTSYNASLTESWHYGQGHSDLSELTPGVIELNGIDFDVRGMIQVGGIARNRRPYPRVVTGIPVRQTCARLHFLHSAITALRTPAGVAIGTYRVHYADGRQIEIPQFMMDGLEMP